MSLGPFFVGDLPVSPATIDITRNGETVALSGYNAIDVSLLGPDGSNITPAPSAAIVGSEAKITFPATSVFATAGVYTLVPVLKNTGVQEVADPLGILVNATPYPSGGWVTPARVLQITRQTVTQADIDSATFVISALTGRDLEDPTVFGSSDQRNLGFAIAWQSAWMLANPTIMTDVLATSKAVGDVSISYDTASSGGTPWLAPLARISLNKMSWRGSKTVLLSRLTDRVPVNVLADDDESTGWVPTPEYLYKG